MTRIPEAEVFAAYAERIAKLDYPNGSFDETELKKYVEFVIKEVRQKGRTG